MIDIKKLPNGGRAKRVPGDGDFFFDTLLYHFIYIIIKTLYISSFIVVFVIYFTHC